MRALALFASTWWAGISTWGLGCSGAEELKSAPSERSLMEMTAGLRGQRAEGLMISSLRPPTDERSSPSAACSAAQSINPSGTSSLWETCGHGSTTASFRPTTICQPLSPTDLSASQPVNSSIKPSAPQPLGPSAPWGSVCTIHPQTPNPQSLALKH